MSYFPPRPEIANLLYSGANDEWTFVGPDNQALAQGKESTLAQILNRLSGDGWEIRTHSRGAVDPTDVIVLARPRPPSPVEMEALRQALQETVPTPLGILPRAIPARQMLERGVEGHLFHPHPWSADCEAKGCVRMGAGWVEGAFGTWGPPPSAPGEPGSAPDGPSAPEGLREDARSLALLAKSTTVGDLNNPDFVEEMERLIEKVLGKTEAY